MEISNLVNYENHINDKEQFALDVLNGLSRDEKMLSTKYFYDDKGSELFQKITKHEDYYLTRTEYEILKQANKEIANIISEDEVDIVELGAGDGHKSKLIIEGLLESGKTVNYYPIDISAEAMKQLEEVITPNENLQVHGVVAEYFEGLRYINEKSRNRKLVLFLGSNIGNFNRHQSHYFLQHMWNGLEANDMALIGFDLKKDVEKLTAAYNDSSGYTKEFNLNLLERINKELGGNFEPENFQHVGIFNPKIGAMESYLLPKKDQSVYIKSLKKAFHFEAFEPLHLEYSFKYTKGDIETMCFDSGFQVAKHFTDKNEYFIDSLWRVVKA
ncbi:L-histidine N(alpha)-methyltransferase [Halobacteriovorax sp. YZS-1-1]|uniref:L-histidine N(alpha)-methyltransferase n=1 Tax=unclassified Halobacteriovorax TaxID=2639665 RepID=UPI00399B0E87